MLTGRRLLAVVGAVALVVAIFVASEAGAAVLKHKQSGETIKGTLTKQKINNLTLFKLEGGGTKLINPDEWEVLEADPEPAEPAAAVAAEDASAPATAVPTVAPKTEKTPPVKCYVIPISGEIMHYAMVEALQKATAEAKKKNATVVIFRLNTPGGRVDLGDKIIQLIEEADDWATVVAWVSGDEKRALSCGAWISLATQKIFMAPGTTIGAATPYRINTGAAEIDEKMTSAFRARFRALSQQRGHPSAIADAMVDDSMSVVQVFLDGKQMLVTADEAKQMEKEHEGTDRFKRGKTVSASGKLITLTDQEALQYEVCSGIVTTPAEIMKALGHEAAVVEEAAWVPEWVEKESRARTALWEKYNAEFEVNLNRANWATSRTSCRKFIEQAAKSLSAIEAMQADPRMDIPVHQENINRMKAQLQAVYDSLATP